MKTENSSSSGEAKEFNQQNMYCWCFQADQKKLTLSVRFHIECRVGVCQNDLLN